MILFFCRVLGNFSTEIILFFRLFLSRRDPAPNPFYLYKVRAKLHLTFITGYDVDE